MVRHRKVVLDFFVDELRPLQGPLLIQMIRFADTSWGMPYLAMTLPASAFNSGFHVLMILSTIGWSTVIVIGIISVLCRGFIASCPDEDATANGNTSATIASLL